MQPNHQRNRLIVSMRNEGIGPREIARRLDLSPCIVAGVLHRAGMCTEQLGRGNGATDTFRSMVLDDLAAGKSYSMVAAKWGVCVSSIHNWRREAQKRSAELEPA